MGILRTLAVMVEQLGPEHVSVDVQVEPLRPDRKRFVLDVDAGEFEWVSQRLGSGFGKPAAPPHSPATSSD